MAGRYLLYPGDPFRATESTPKELTPVGIGVRKQERSCLSGGFNVFNS